MAGIRSYGRKPGSCDMKVVNSDHASIYSAFGWVRSKETVPSYRSYTGNKREKLVLLKRNPAFGSNYFISANEEEFDKLYNKNFKDRKRKDVLNVIFGILFFVLMLGCFGYGGYLLYNSIGSGDIKPDVLRNIVLLLVAGIASTVFFSLICTTKKRREKRNARMATIVEQVSGEVVDMRTIDPSLMSKEQRRQRVWEGIFSKALANNRPQIPAPVVIMKKDRDDEDDYDF